MNLGKALAYFAVGLGMAWPAARAQAADYKLGPGETMTVTADLVLQVGDTLTFSGTPDNNCMLVGGGFTISTADSWAGDFVMENCTVTGLGASTPEIVYNSDAGAQNVQTHKLALDIATDGKLTLAGNTFHKSGGINLGVGQDCVPQIVNNTIADDSVVDVFQDSATYSQPALHVTGFNNTAPKVLQGNRIFKSGIVIENAKNWLVGGSSPGQGNIIIGTRAGIGMSGVDQIQIVGNYIRPTLPLDKWNEVEAITFIGQHITIEHNVIHGGNWNLDVEGDAEIRFNLLVDSYDRPWLLLESMDFPEVIHHNIFIRTDPANVPIDNMVFGVQVLHKGMTRTEIFNNTFYSGRHQCWGAMGPAVVVERADPGTTDEPFLDSLRSNVFAEFPIDIGNGGPTAAVRGGTPGVAGGWEAMVPAPARLGYADYNLFHNPDALLKENYGLSVKGGAREGFDTGFAAHDPPGPAGTGVIDQQVDPRFVGVAQPADPQYAGQIPVGFAFNDADVIAGTTSVCQILRFYQQIFTPGPGSPLIDAGDPADGAGNDIGAVGAGMPNAGDQFASICGPDIGTPNVSAAVFTCPPNSRGQGGTGSGGQDGGAGSGGQGGGAGQGDGGPGGQGDAGGTGGHNPGFICVCETSGPPSSAAASLALLFSAALIFVRRRRAPRVRPDRMR
ncbi:MAG TPA: hypothetical protein VMU50_18940 [Polyangia bacterium]|nr:hypothetical protein [Polyangia bacterium]